jgi:TolB protein
MRSRNPLRLACVAVACLAATQLVLAPRPAEAAGSHPNGRIAFTANIDPAGRWDLFTMRADGTGVRRIAKLPDPTWPFAQPDWSPNGHRIIFISPSPTLHHTQVYRVNADGTGLRQLTHSAGTDNDFASWSPDGSKILLSRVSDREHAIWVMNANGTGLRMLTSDRYDNAGPKFTPDGKHIVYSSEKGGLVSAIWIMKADGTQKHRLTPPALEAANPDVAPTGSRIVFINNAGHETSVKPSAIYTMRIDGSHIKRLTTPGCCHHDSLPRYSPNSHKIVFITDRNYPLLDGTDIYTMNTDGTHQRQITTNLTIGGWPDFPIFDAVQPDWGARSG